MLLSLLRESDDPNDQKNVEFGKKTNYKWEKAQSLLWSSTFWNVAKEE